MAPPYFPWTNIENVSTLDFPLCYEEGAAESPTYVFTSLFSREDLNALCD